MKIKIQPHNLALAPADCARLQQQLLFTLEGHQADIREVTVWFANLGGGNEHGLKRCLIEVKLVNGSFVIGETVESDLNRGIDRAVGRIATRLALSLASKPREKAAPESPFPAWQGLTPAGEYRKLAGYSP